MTETEELAAARQKLRRIRALADMWETRWGDDGIRASLVAEVLRREIGDLS
jgi:hypothetical protein